MPWPTGACPAVRGEPTLTGLPACLPACLSARHQACCHPATPDDGILKRLLALNLERANAVQA